MRLEQWKAENTIRNEMNWKSAAEAQFEFFAKLAFEFGGDEPRVVGTHTSKSIILPVVEIEGKHGRFLLRDNFYDINLCVVWDFAPAIHLSDVYPTLDWDWYTEQIERCAGYSWKGWSEEELADPRILRVQRPNGTWNEVLGAEKDRWNKRLEDPEWYGRDWSGGELIAEGSMGPDVKLYRVDKAFLQGLDRVAPFEALEPFRPGRSSFAVATSRDAVGPLMHKIEEAGRA